MVMSEYNKLLTEYVEYTYMIESTKRNFK